MRSDFRSPQSFEFGSTGSFARTLAGDLDREAGSEAVGRGPRYPLGVLGIIQIDIGVEPEFVALLSKHTEQVAVEFDDKVNVDVWTDDGGEPGHRGGEPGTTWWMTIESDGPDASVRAYFSPDSLFAAPQLIETTHDEDGAHAVGEALRRSRRQLVVVAAPDLIAAQLLDQLGRLMQSKDELRQLYFQALGDLAQANARIAALEREAEQLRAADSTIKDPETRHLLLKGVGYGLVALLTFGGGQLAAIRSGDSDKAVAATEQQTNLTNLTFDRLGSNGLPDDPKDLAVIVRDTAKRLELSCR